MSSEFLHINTIDTRLLPVRDVFMQSLIRITTDSLCNYGIVNNRGKHIRNPWLNQYHIDAIHQCIAASTQNVLSSLSFRPALTLRDRINQEALYSFVMYEVNYPEINMDKLNNTCTLHYSYKGSVRRIQIALRPDTKSNG